MRKTNNDNNFLANSVQHFTLHSMLKLPAANHRVNDLHYCALLVFLTQEIL